MLHQNWFMDKRFEMFEEYAESQSFYDTETKNIYVVMEEYGQKGSTIIQEITPESFEYQANISRYNEWKNKNRKNWKKTEYGVEYYVSPNTGWVYMFYDMKALSEKYPNTDMMCCMCEYYHEQGILEGGYESLEVMEIVGWQFAPDGIPYEDMENMIACYEDKRVDREVD